MIRKICFPNEVPTPPSSDNEDEDEDNLEVQTRERVKEMCVNIEEIKTSLQRLEKRVDEQLGGLKDLLLQVIDKVNIALQEKGGPSAPSHHEKDTEICAPHAEVQKMSTHGVDNA
ncbi:unnamed protein product, partial [Cuscuta epithymum]